MSKAARALSSFWNDEHNRQISIGSVILIVSLSAFAGIDTCVQNSSEEDSKSRLVASFVGPAARGDWPGLYSSFHPRLKARMSYQEARELMEEEPALRVASVGRAEKRQDNTSTIHLAAVVEGISHRMVVKREEFTGLTQITDGQIVSLVQVDNLPCITDILVDGKSLFDGPLMSE